MLTQAVDLDPFIDNLRSMISTIVVKQDQEANKYETVEIRTDADRYVAMMDGSYDFNSFATFDPDVMAAAGMNNTLISLALTSGKDAIPYEFRDLCVQMQHDKIINTYVEKNNYYRMLHGEPPVEDTEKDFVYAPKNNDQGIPSDIPVHLLPSNYIEYLNASDLREKLYEETKKPYLLHMGTHAISYYKARQALNYEILYLEKSDNKFIAADFIKYYMASRNYVMYGLYNKADQRTYDNYDGFMGLVILTMAIQRTFTGVFKQGITRDFYDDNLIRYLYEAYNIQYIDSIDVSYQRIIAKKLNVLLQKKSSNQVLYDISSIFDYDVNIYKYYLMKDYKKDTNGDPIFIYKKIYDEKNQVHEVIDPEKTYDIYFQKVNIRSKDPTLELTNRSNRVEYNAITGGDAYWIEDSDLLDKIYNSRYNYTLTKYMSIDISYELSKIMYETSYCFRMVIDDQEEYKMIYMNLPWVTAPVSLFDVILFCCALVAKKFNLAGNVPLKPYQICQVYGFNFKEDIPKLKQNIINDIEACHGEYRAVREEILDYLKELHADSLEGARKMFDNINDLRKWLDKGLRYSTNMEEYAAYRKIYHATLVSHDVQELYTKNDGTYASTFAELLKDRRGDLYAVLARTGNTKNPDGTPNPSAHAAYQSLNNMINKVLDKLSEISEKLRDLRYMNDKEAMVNNIEKLINQMKSYTVDQTASNIKYLINDPHLCLLKILAYCYTVSKDAYVNDKIKMLYEDCLDQIVPRRVWTDKIDLEHFLESDITARVYEIIRLVNQLTYSKKTTNLDMGMMLYDAMHTYIKHNKDMGIISLKELYDYEKVWDMHYPLKIGERIHIHPTDAIGRQMLLWDAVGAAKSRELKDILLTMYHLEIMVHGRAYENLRLVNNLALVMIHRVYCDNTQIMDYAKESKQWTIEGKLKIEEGVNIHKTMMPEEDIRLINDLYSAFKLAVENTPLYLYDTYHEFKLNGIYKDFFTFENGVLIAKTTDAYEKFRLRYTIKENKLRTYIADTKLYDTYMNLKKENYEEDFNLENFLHTDIRTDAFDILRIKNFEVYKFAKMNLRNILYLDNVMAPIRKWHIQNHMKLPETHEMYGTTYGYEFLPLRHQRVFEKMMIDLFSVTYLDNTVMNLKNMEVHHTFFMNPHAKKIKTTDVYERIPFQYQKVYEHAFGILRSITSIDSYTGSDKKVDMYHGLNYGDDVLTRHTTNAYDKLPLRYQKVFEHASGMYRSITYLEDSLSDDIKNDTFNTMKIGKEFYHTSKNWNHEKLHQRHKLSGNMKEANRTYIYLMDSSSDEHTIRPYENVGFHDQLIKNYIS